MTAGEGAYVRERMERARKALHEASVLLDAGHLATAVSSIYHACFYAVSALLYCEGHTSRRHAGLRALFDQHSIRAGRLPPELGRFYAQIFERRLESDHGFRPAYQAGQVADWLEQAQLFVEQIGSEVERLTAAGGAARAEGRVG